MRQWTFRKFEVWNCCYKNLNDQIDFSGKLKNEIAVIEKLDDQIELFENLKYKIAVLKKLDQQIEL